MTIDYKALAAEDTGETLDVFFARLSAEKIASKPKKMMTYISIANEVSFTGSSSLEKGVATATANGQLPAWVDDALKSSGVDVNDPQTGALLDAIVPPETATAIKAAGVVYAPKYPDLKEGYLQNARDWYAIWSADTGDDMTSVNAINQTDFSDENEYIAALRSVRAEMKKATAGKVSALLGKDVSYPDIDRARKIWGDK